MEKSKKINNSFELNICLNEEALMTGIFILAKFNNELEDIEKMYIKQWVYEFKPKIYLLKEKVTKKILCFALLGEVDFDLEGKHKKPHTLHFIYTPIEYRRQGYARKLLIRLKSNKVETTSFCSTDESIALYEKSKYILRDSIFNRYCFP